MVEERYQVCCSCCDLVTAVGKKREAFDKAVEHYRKHRRHDMQFRLISSAAVVVFDVMARRGAWQEWTVHAGRSLCYPRAKRRV